MKRGDKFVWVKTQRGCAPEKWPHDMPPGASRDKVVLAEHQLSADEFRLTIAILEQRYPPPRDSDEPKE